MTQHTVSINRAPVLTLWAEVVAERLGYSRDEALTLGKAVAGLNAQSKGQRLGIYGKPTAGERAKRAAEKPAAGGTATAVELLGRSIPVKHTKDGVRAVTNGRVTDPGSVERYLEGKFGDALGDARTAFTALARARGRTLAGEAFALYEQFRPSIPSGQRGWGAKGVLDLDQVRALARGGRQAAAGNGA